ncbi:PilZ domain-containing protein [bacterium]|nr:PilZ domain-containing protein [bacterium]
MRELIEKDKLVLIVPHDFKCANKGIITDVQPDKFTVELEYEPQGFMKHNFCEFFTNTNHGTLSFNSYPLSIEGKKLVIASPAKHKFLQRRQYTRIKYNHNLKINNAESELDITTLDISAGGMKLITNSNIDIEAQYNVSLPLSSAQKVDCTFSPIRIEKRNEGGYLVSGRFLYNSSIEKMTLIQYCAKRSIEIRNK